MARKALATGALCCAITIIALASFHRWDREAGLNGGVQENSASGLNRAGAKAEGIPGDAYTTVGGAASEEELRGRASGSQVRSDSLASSRGVPSVTERGAVRTPESEGEEQAKLESSEEISLHVESGAQFASFEEEDGSGTSYTGLVVDGKPTGYWLISHPDRTEVMRSSGFQQEGMWTEIVHPNAEFPAGLAKRGRRTGDGVHVGPWRSIQPGVSGELLEYDEQGRPIGEHIKTTVLRHTRQAFVDGEAGPGTAQFDYPFRLPSGESFFSADVDADGSCVAGWVTRAGGSESPQFLWRGLRVISYPESMMVGEADGGKSFSGETVVVIYGDSERRTIMSVALLNDRMKEEGNGFIIQAGKYVRLGRFQEGQPAGVWETYLPGYVVKAALDERLQPSGPTRIEYVNGAMESGQMNPPGVRRGEWTFRHPDGMTETIDEG